MLPVALLTGSAAHAIHIKVASEINTYEQQSTTHNANKDEEALPRYFYDSELIRLSSLEQISSAIANSRHSGENAKAGLFPYVPGIVTGTAAIYEELHKKA